MFVLLLLDESYTHFRLEFRGPENTLRVRQIKLLGSPVIIEDFNYKPNQKSINAFQIQQRNCETETLRVFRLITAQVGFELLSIFKYEVYRFFCLSRT